MANPYIDFLGSSDAGADKVDWDDYNSFGSFAPGMSSGDITGASSSFGDPEWAKSALSTGMFGSAGTPSGYQGGFGNKWSDAYLKALQAKNYGYGLSKGNTSTTGGMVTDLPGANTALLQPFSKKASGWGEYKMYTPPPKEKSKSFFNRITNAGLGFLKGAATGTPHMAGVGAVGGFMA